MINEKFYDEMKEHLITNISDTFTLNLAISLLEDSKKYKVDSKYYKQALNEIREYCDKNIKKVYVYYLEEIIKKVNKVLGDDE